MVTIGFIVEGDSEAILVKDPSFIDFLQSINITTNRDLVINAGSKTYLYHPTGNVAKLKARVDSWINVLQAKGAEVVMLLLDFDNSDPCFTLFKPKVYHHSGNLVVIARQALEAWYLADTSALSSYLNAEISFLKPEDPPNPYEAVKALKIELSGKGVGDKKHLTRHMLRAGFSLSNAAAHPNCPSATYFLNKLLSLNTP